MALFMEHPSTKLVPIWSSKLMDCCRDMDIKLQGIWKQSQWSGTDIGLLQEMISRVKSQTTSKEIGHKNNTHHRHLYPAYKCPSKEKDCIFYHMDVLIVLTESQHLATPHFSTAHPTCLVSCNFFNGTVIATFFDYSLHITAERLTVCLGSW